MIVGLAPYLSAPFSFWSEKVRASHVKLWAMAEQTDENLSNTIFGKYEVRQLEILLLNYQRLCFKT